MPAAIRVLQVVSSTAKCIQFVYIEHTASEHNIMQQPVIHRLKKRKEAIAVSREKTGSQKSCCMAQLTGISDIHCSHMDSTHNWNNEERCCRKHPFVHKNGRICQTSDDGDDEDDDDMMI